jgi:hypothetical protein
VGGTGRLSISSPRHPARFRVSGAFAAEPEPLWTWEIEGVRVTRRLQPPAPARRRPFDLSGQCRLPAGVRLFTATRGYHALGTGPETPLRFAMPGAVWQPVNDWYRNVEYLEELDRGFPFREDLWCPGTFTCSANTEFTASLGGPGSLPPRTGARGLPVPQARPGDPVGLAVFLVHATGPPRCPDCAARPPARRPASRATRGRSGGITRRRQSGLPPNLFVDRGGEPEYNTIDATLGRSKPLTISPGPANGSGCIPGVSSHRRRDPRGASAGYAVRHRHWILPTGLLRGGEETTQLTWMGRPQPRSAGHPAPWQARRDQCPLVQRPAPDGGLGRRAWGCRPPDASTRRSPIG